MSAARALPLAVLLIATSASAVQQDPAGQPLGTLGGRIGYTVVRGMGDDGTIVGIGQVASLNLDYQGFRWNAGTLTPLPGLTGPGNTDVAAVNAAGQAAGTSLGEDGFFHAVRWTSDGVIEDLGRGPGFGARAKAINALGNVAGDMTTADGATHAFFWSPSTGFRDLGTLGGAWSRATALNGQNQVIGDADLASGASHGFLWKAQGGMRDLGTFGGLNSTATALNDAGQVAGHAQLPSGAYRAFRFSKNRLTDLGTLGGDSYPSDINEAGMVVGTSADRPFRWTEAGGMVPLATLAGGNGAAVAVNDAGQVAGKSTAANARARAVLWSATGILTDLGNDNDYSSEAVALNAAGHVAASRVEVSTWSKGFFWSPETERFNIPGFGPGRGIATHLTSNGLVAGQSLNVDGVDRAFLYSGGPLVEIAGFPAGEPSRPVGLNANGQMIGQFGASESRAFYVSPTEPFFEFTTGGSATVVAINAAGQVAGYAYDFYSQPYVFVWSEADDYAEIVPAAGATAVQPSDINDAGMVVGTYTAPDTRRRAFSWTAVGGFRDLGDLGGGTATAYDVNNSGEVAGESVNRNGETHAFLRRTNNQLVDLGTLGNNYSTAVALNDNGHVIGYAPTATGATHAFLRDTQMRDLGDLGGNYSVPRGVNGLKEVVGMSSDAGFVQRAFLWTPARGLRRLDIPSGLMAEARAINAAGQVVGQGAVGNGETQPILWTTR